MDRINIKCLIDGKEIDLQLDKKAMPGEPEPCYMITAEGCFKGYILCKNTVYQFLGTAYYTDTELKAIGDRLNKIKSLANNS